MSALGRLESVARSIVSFLAPYDAVVTPALASRPLKTGEVHGRGPDHWDHFRRSGLFTPYTAIINVMRASRRCRCPLYQGDDGLPTGVQLIGRAAGEGPLLALAAQLERALPWADRRSTAHGSSPLRAPPSSLRGTTPRRSASALPWREVIGTCEQLRLVPRRRRRRPHQQLGQLQRALDDPLRDVDDRTPAVIGARAPSRRCPGGSASPDPASSYALVGWRARRSAAITHSATSSAQIGWNAARPVARDRHHRQQRHPLRAASGTGRSGSTRSTARTPCARGSTRSALSLRSPSL